MYVQLQKNKVANILSFMKFKSEAFDETKKLVPKSIGKPR